MLIALLPVRLPLAQLSNLLVASGRLANRSITSMSIGYTK
jgi:hypothetical protein